METIAVYWEENIRTYGIQVEKGLCLARTVIQPSRLAAIGQQITNLGRDGTGFRSVLVQQSEPGVLSLFMLAQEAFRERLHAFGSRSAVKDLFRSHTVDFPVEMLNFHGPHFGDRYGIADMAVHALQKQDIGYIVMGCSAASVYLIFPENVADKAKKALLSVFQAA